MTDLFKGFRSKPGRGIIQSAQDVGRGKIAGFLDFALMARKSSKRRRRR